MSSKTILAAGLLACLVPAAALAADRPGYGDAVEFFETEAQYEAWFTLVRNLRRDFDWICGDTFCEGDYSNIQPLRFGCSVHRSSGRVGMCVWTFAASQEEIAQATGRIGVQRAFWECRMPLGAGTRIDQLLDALAVDAPLYAPLPGQQRSVMDALIDCL